ncbi:MAG TPA: DNA mismatch repair endonuclease MutL [Candidatus Pullichristensenella excrementipullorum]|nr:DNA mismatch repair endonuclease MutL [Candidatus Pullichristensenella excrementipullorum]
MPIRILDAATVGRIAAGEVVERPASVVKELVENSLDAGATSVTVEIRDGGIGYMRVTDNGCGIEPGQVRLAFENHATSKLVTPEQLDDIRTLGFRGEALPSIAAVARVEMTTRAKAQEAGTRLNVEGGRNMIVREIGCPEGTTVIMRDLFFNIPVRRAFLRKAQYEAALVNDTVARMILGSPKISFRFINNGRTVYHSFGDGDLRHAVFAVYGRETAENMLEVDQSEGAMRIRGLVGVGEQAKATRAHEAFFINGRSVRCPLLSQALESVCRERVTIGMYPMCALHLTLAPGSVDVNVHPNKLEVRFRDEAATRIAVESMLRDALQGGSMLRLKAEKPAIVEEKHTVEQLPLPDMDNVTANTTEVQNAQTEVVNQKTEVSDIATKVVKDALPDDAFEALIQAERRRLGISPSGSELRETAFAPWPKRSPVPDVMTFAGGGTVPFAQMHAPMATKTPPAQPVEQLTLAQDKDSAPYRVIGVLFKTYILLECEDAFLLIDQHAAHERLRYDALAKAVEEGVASQRLLTPQIVRVSAREMTLVEENMDALTAAGYDISPIGDRDLQIRAVPHIHGHAELTPRFMDVISSLSGLGSAALEARRDEILQAACKGAVKAGDALSDSEIKALLSQMEASGAPPTCPHGRPVIKTFSRREIERMFRRIQ